MTGDSWRFSEDFIAAHTAYELAVSENRESSPCDWVDLEGPFAPLMVASLLRSGAAVVDFDQLWLKDQVSKLPKSMKLDVIALVRGVFEDQVSLGLRPRWACYSVWGFSASELDLRMPGEPFPLGCEISEDWYLAERISAGGFGVVYLGISLADEQMIAVKAPLRLVGTDTRRQIESLRHEYLTLKRLSMAGVPRALGFVEVHDTAVLLMEYMDGVNMRGKKPLSTFEVLSILSKAGRILDNIHRAGFMFSDLKPENIIIHKDKTVSLIDFGAVRDLRPSANEEESLAGTEDYMDPLWILGASEASAISLDMFSLREILYEQVTGRSSKAETREICSGLETHEIIELAKTDYPFLAGTPEGISNILTRCCGVSPNIWTAFLTTGEFADACEQILANPDAIPAAIRRPEVHAFDLGIHISKIFNNGMYFSKHAGQAWWDSEEIAMERYERLSEIRLSINTVFRAARNIGLELAPIVLKQPIVDQWLGASAVEPRQLLEIDEDRLEFLLGWCDDAVDVVHNHLDTTSPSWLFFIFWTARMPRCPHLCGDLIDDWPEILRASRIPTSIYERLARSLPNWKQLPVELMRDQLDNWEYDMRRFLLWDYPEMPDRDLWAAR